MIGTGDRAPDFALPSATGEIVALSALLPRKVVVFFYPKDDTPTCTDEVTGFSAAATAFAQAGVALVGISKDSPRRHANFTSKYKLNVTLLSDLKSDTCERWGVWGEKQMFGRKYLGIIRSTFLIAPDGSVAKVWSPVRVPGHVEDVYEAAEAA